MVPRPIVVEVNSEVSTEDPMLLVNPVTEEMDFENRNGLVWEGFVMKQDVPYEAVENPAYCSYSWHKWRLK